MGLVHGLFGGLGVVAGAGGVEEAVADAWEFDDLVVGFVGVIGEAVFEHFDVIGGDLWVERAVEGEERDVEVEDLFDGGVGALGGDFGVEEAAVEVDGAGGAEFEAGSHHGVGAAHIDADEGEGLSGGGFAFGVEVLDGGVDVGEDLLVGGGFVSGGGVGGVESIGGAIDAGVEVGGEDGVAEFGEGVGFGFGKIGHAEDVVDEDDAAGVGVVFGGDEVGGDVVVGGFEGDHFAGVGWGGGGGGLGCGHGLGGLSPGGGGEGGGGQSE